MIGDSLCVAIQNGPEHDGPEFWESPVESDDQDAAPLISELIAAKNNFYEE